MLTGLPYVRPQFWSLAPCCFKTKLTRPSEVRGALTDVQTLACVCVCVCVCVCEICVQFLNWAYNIGVLYC